MEIKSEQIFEGVVEHDNAKPQYKHNHHHQHQQQQQIQEAADLGLKSYQESILDRQPLVGEDQIIASKLNPEDAFQVFNGRVFTQTKPEYYSLADAIERRVESPQQRLSRIRNDLDTLKFDLDTMVETNNEEKPSSSIWSVLQAQTVQLKESAEALEHHKAFELAKAQKANPEKSLSELIEGLQKLNAGSTADGKNDSTAVVVSKGMSSTAATNQDVVALENRVHKLETMLGSICNYSDAESIAQLHGASTGWGGGATASSSQIPFPLIDAIARLESRVMMLSSSEIEVLRGKCNALKLDLDATVKSRATSQTEARVIEAANVLKEFIRKVEKVETIAGDLPNLVLRLKTLEYVHLSASTFQTRLQQIESDVRDISGELASNKDVLAALKDTLSENMKIMQDNVAAVSKRI